MNSQLEYLIKTLNILSSSAEKQLKLLGSNDIPLTMSVDFDCSYLDHRKEFIDLGILNSRQVETLDKLDEFFRSISWLSDNPADETFWEDRDVLITHPDWEKVRELAQSCLVLMKNN